MIVKIEGTCQYKGCDQPATCIASGRETYAYAGIKPGHPTPGCYCEAHAEMIEDEQSPEYHVTCPNCECQFGVG